MNALDPNQINFAQRLPELADLLGDGVVRLRLPKSSELSADRSESSLVLPSHQSNPGKPVICERGAV